MGPDVARPPTRPFRRLLIRRLAGAGGGGGGGGFAPASPPPAPPAVVVVVVVVRGGVLVAELLEVVALLLGLQDEVPQPAVRPGQLRDHEQGAAREGRALLLGHLEESLTESRDAFEGDVGAEGLEAEGEEHGELGGAREGVLEEDGVEGAVEAVADGLAGGHELVEEDEGLHAGVEGVGVSPGNGKEGEGKWV